MSKKEEKVVVDEKIENEVEEQFLDEKDLKIISLEEKNQQLSEEIESIKKAAADIVNRSKKIEVEKKYASSDLVRNLLVPMSYFEGALKFKSNDENFNNFLKGFEMVYNLLLDQLNNDGLKEITTNISDPFNPYIHEIHELVEVEDDGDKILEVIQKGFYYKDRVIRPVKVKVSKIKEVNESLDEEALTESNNSNEENN